MRHGRGDDLRAEGQFVGTHQVDGVSSGVDENALKVVHKRQGRDAGQVK